MQTVFLNGMNVHVVLIVMVEKQQPLHGLPQQLFQIVLLFWEQTETALIPKNVIWIQHINNKFKIVVMKLTVFLKHQRVHAVSVVIAGVKFVKLVVLIQILKPVKNLTNNVQHRQLHLGLQQQPVVVEQNANVYKSLVKESTTPTIRFVSDTMKCVSFQQHPCHVKLCWMKHRPMMKCAKNIGTCILNVVEMPVVFMNMMPKFVTAVWDRVVHLQHPQL